MAKICGGIHLLRPRLLTRVHRIGQNKTVCVYRLVVRGTIEDRILVIQHRKQEMADQAMGEAIWGALANIDYNGEW